MVPLLPRRIPNLEFYRRIVHRQRLRKESSPNSRFLKQKPSQNPNYKPLGKKKKNKYVLKGTRNNLEFEELAFDEAKNEARFPRAHISQKNLQISSRNPNQRR